MAGLRVKIEGERAILDGLKRLDPSQNARIAGPALTEMMILSLRIAAQQKIRRGGGGKPRARILTSRTGALRRSLSGGRSLDKAGLPRSIEGGSNLRYAALHETGGTFAVKESRVGPQARTMAFGRNVNVFEVPAHTRKAHTVKFPKRAYLAPALTAASKQFEAIFVKHWERQL